MRLRRKHDSAIVGGDLTPMIDMTFQLIAFFMVLINFTEAESDQRIQLPTSILAKPPDGPLESPIYLQMSGDGQVVWNGDLVPMEQMEMHLISETEILRYDNKTPADATIIIRADGRVATGKVQELIQLCQKRGFENFALRALEEVGH